ncbi:HAD family hydrolase [Glaciimonas soli]|uniref:HAD-IA family hydrolase n=1 Tax=Glaciimonas soli TaxID=2590999 RepID=A0A843YYF0_9BURK|nr:HAD-IA family hydrolase [Glaciimonas soli]MQR02694.1 HAD-IA family hydrolase [Glaciimonas soli]
MKSEPIELIIFDSDGTLVDSEGLTDEAIVACAAEFGAQLSLAEMERFKGGNMNDCIAHIESVRGTPLPRTAFQALLREYAFTLYQQRLQPIAGAPALLQALKTPFCLASNGPREKIEHCLKITSLFHHFEQDIFSAYEVGAWKPAPDLFLHAAQQKGVAPSRCVVVEDSIPGVQAGIAAGMRVFALQAGHTKANFPPEVTVISALSELHQHLM